MYEPVREGVFAPREEERIRVSFRNDRVVSIEQAQQTVRGWLLVFLAVVRG